MAHYQEVVTEYVGIADMKLIPYVPAEFTDDPSLKFVRPAMRLKDLVWVCVW